MGRAPKTCGELVPSLIDFDPPRPNAQRDPSADHHSVSLSLRLVKPRNLQLVDQFRARSFHSQTALRVISQPPKGTVLLDYKEVFIAMSKSRTSSERIFTHQSRLPMPDSLVSPWHKPRCRKSKQVLMEPASKPHFP